MEFLTLVALIFGIAGFVTGLMGITKASAAKKETQELERRISRLEDRLLSQR